MAHFLCLEATQADCSPEVDDANNQYSESSYLLSSFDQFTLICPCAWYLHIFCRQDFLQSYGTDLASYETFQPMIFMRLNPL